MDYFNTFLALNVVAALLSMQGQKAFRLNQKKKFNLINLICVHTMNRGLTGLERHESE